MHSRSTRDEFLKLRLQGLSFAAIGRRLHVSKPTLIAWSKQSKPLLDDAMARHRFTRIDDAASRLSAQLAALKRKHDFLKHELLSRSLREIPTHDLETLLGQCTEKISSLTATATDPDSTFTRSISTSDRARFEPNRT